MRSPSSLLKYQSAVQQDTQRGRPAIRESLHMNGFEEGRLAILRATCDCLPFTVLQRAPGKLFQYHVCPILEFH